MKITYTALALLSVLTTQNFATSVDNDAMGNYVADAKDLTIEEKELQSLELNVRIYQQVLNSLENEIPDVHDKYHAFFLQKYKKVSATGDFDAEYFYKDYISNQSQVTEGSPLQDIVEEYGKAITCYYNLKGALESSGKFAAMMLEKSVKDTLKDDLPHWKTQLMDRASTQSALYEMKNMREMACSAIDHIRKKSQLINDHNSILLFLKSLVEEGVVAENVTVEKLRAEYKSR